MNKLTTGVILSSLLFSTSFSAIAESGFISEILIGQSKHKVNATPVNYQSEKKYESNLDDKSLAFRVGYKYTDYLTFELAKYDHGSVTNKVELRSPTQLPGTPSGGACCFGPEYDIIHTAILPIEIDSLRLGVKGQWQLLSNVSINARVGIARWEFGTFSPKHLTVFSSRRNEDVSGNDFYYGVGAEYRFTENFYLGVEYSILSIKESYSDENDVSGSYNYDVKDLSLVLGWAF